jgi:class 3 adenylate cyclase
MGRPLFGTKVRATHWRVDDVQTLYAKSGTATIAYQIVGTGPIALVMVPGFVSNVEIAWELPEKARFLRRLASFSRLLVFDKRGTGASERVPLDQLPSLDERMDDVRAVMDAAGCERASIFGISEGGPLSLVFAATYPDRVDRLVLYGSYASRREAQGSRDDLVSRIEADWGTGKVLGERSASLLSDQSARSALAKYERQSATPAAAAALIRMAFDIDVRDIVGSVSVPTLVIHRTDDPVLNVEAARALAERLPDGRYCELPGGDHSPWTGDSEAVLQEIERFLVGSERYARVDRVLATVLFADIVDSTRTAAKLGDAQWKASLEEYYAIAQRFVAQFRGSYVATTGDGFLATFDGPARAIRCAESIQRASARIGIEMRAGLHTGEVELRGSDLAGIGVHICARVCALAHAGEVLVSRTVVDLVAGAQITFLPRGEHELKGVPGTWQLFAVVGDDTEA